MKKRMLLLLVLLIQIAAGFSQDKKVIVTDDNQVQVDLTQFDLKVVQPSYGVIKDSSAKPDTSRRYMVWLEPGNGFYTTNPLMPYEITGRQSHIPFMLATKLYDTTKNPHPTAPHIRKMKLLNNTQQGSFYKNLENDGVKIIPNAFDIVPGDSMAFALHYRAMENGDTTVKLYFFYNNNRTFEPISEKNKQFTVNGTELFDACRTHNDEEVSYQPSLSDQSIKADFKDWVCFTIPNVETRQREKAVFVSLTPFQDLELGKTGSVYAVLTDVNDKVIATDIIENMRFAPAHDPNYLTQRPFCLKFSKKEYPFNYTIHFQNTGAGPADNVKVVIHLPKGLNWGTLKINKVNFAGADYAAFIKTKDLVIDRNNNTVTVNFLSAALMKNNKKNWLLGTASSSRPSVDPATMGEIIFTIQSTPNTDDSLTAYADIYFGSVHPSKTAVGGYELPVTTDTAITRYKVCCDCNSPIPAAGCYIIWGLCWWWWLLILLALLISWWLLAKRKKDKTKKANTEYGNGN